MSISLKELSLENEKSFQRANSENWEEGFVFAHYFCSLANQKFQNYVKLLPMFSSGKALPPGHVPCTTLFAYNEDNEIVGRVSIRHELNDQLTKVGGHIGYGVCPSYRRRGYATLILKEALNYISENIPDLKDILVTCDASNIASRKTIEKNGGVLENSLEVDGTLKLRFWITLME